MVGVKIKILREKKGYSINELSEKAGVSKSYLSYIERGIQMNPSLQVLSKVAKTLEINVEELLEHDGDRSAQPIDEDWLELVKEAIENGITKEDFSWYLNFIRYSRKEGEPHQS